VERAIAEATADTARPSLICCKTIIGWGAPNKQGTEATHGAALGEAEVAAARQYLDWPYEPFVIPDELKRAWDARDRGASAEREWTGRLAAFRKAHPELAAEFERRLAGQMPEGWRESLAEFVRATQAKPAAAATRSSSQQVLNVLGAAIPELLGGSADLTGSNNTNHKGSKTVTHDDFTGNYLHYGVREFGMTAIMNGVALHGGFVPYGGTFLVFSDYARNAVRMAALMKQRVILVYTHDSIGLGEDGPTHQPVEHIASLRLIPNMRVWRPCDTVETAAAWADALERRDGPTCLVLSRQALPAMPRSAAQTADIARGGYMLVDCEGRPDCVLIATGSEIGLAADAAKGLTEGGRKVRVVSMPCTSVFDTQPQQYRDSVLPPGVPRVAVEAGATAGWWRYVSAGGAVIGMDSFGASAPASRLFEHFGFTRDNVIRTVEGLLGS
jgi:transketolase